MSDGYWDAEYDKAYYLEKEIKQFCKENNLKVPKFSEYARSWELEKIFKKIKEDLNMKDLLFTLEEKQFLNSIIKKRDALREKYWDYKKKYGTTAGSVFDGGFYTKMLFDKMTKEEYEDFQNIEKELEYVLKLLK